MLANRRRVKPVASLDVDKWFKSLPVVLCPLHLPDLPDPFDITLHKVSGIRLTAVGDHLNRRGSVGALHLFGEIHRNHHQATNFSRLHFGDQFLTVIADGGVDVGRTGHGMGEIQRRFATLFQQNPNPQLAGVEVNAVAKYKQQQQWDHHCNQPATRIANDLPCLFDAQRPHATPGQDRITHCHAPYPSRGSTE